MKIVLFVQSILSDWNHGNAHFLRGIGTELIRRGHEVVFYEPQLSWSFTNLVKNHGSDAVKAFYKYYPQICSFRYALDTLDLNEVFEGVDIAIVHEWNDPQLIKKTGMYRKYHSHVKLFFHDTHHRAATDRGSMGGYDLSYYDGVLAFGEIVKEIYQKQGWARRVWVWHEAADVWVFRPFDVSEKSGDLIWIGNWGDEERSNELKEFLFEPMASMALSGRIYGVRYPREAQNFLKNSGIEYCGWIANYNVPKMFSRYKLTVHIPRRPYVTALPGIPTIRVFEALACGIPLICSPWSDCEGLFTKGDDYLIAENGDHMKECIKAVLNDNDLKNHLISHGRETILKRHTCKHRVDQLFEICAQLDAEGTQQQFNGKKNLLPYVEADK